MSKLEFLNKFILQFFFIRICRIYFYKTKKIIGIGIIYFVFPFIGWGTKFIPIGKKYKTKILWKK